MEHNTKKKHKRRRVSEQGSVGFNDVARNAFLGIGVSLLVMLVLSFIASAICMLSSDPASLTLPSGITIFCVSAAIGGYIGAKRLLRDKTATVVSGILCGFTLMIVTGISATLQSIIAPSSTHGMTIFSSVLIRSSAIPLATLSACLNLKKITKSRKRWR